MAVVVFPDAGNPHMMMIADAVVEDVSRVLIWRRLQIPFNAA
jgi:hypothetical protein